MRSAVNVAAICREQDRIAEVERRHRRMREWLRAQARECPVDSVSKSVAHQARRDARLYREALAALQRF